MFCKLIGAITCRAHPLILFLDDLQWADEMTVRCGWHFLNLRVDTIHVYLCCVLVSLKLDIIRMMMTDPDIRHFVSIIYLFRPYVSWFEIGSGPLMDMPFFFLVFSLQLFLGCYRDNEVNLTHPLTAKLKAIQEQGISIVAIKIGECSTARECSSQLFVENSRSKSQLLFTLSGRANWKEMC